MDATALYAAANTVTFPNRVQVSFDFGIQQVVLVHQVVVVVLNIPPAVRYNDNVFAFAQTGDFLWQIDTIGKGYIPRYARLPLCRRQPYGRER